MAKDCKEIAKQLDEFRREMRAEMRSLREGVKTCSDACDSVVEIQKDLKDLKLEIRRLVEKNQKLEQENRQLREKLDETEQYNRLNNLEIKGLPGTCNEMSVVKEIGRQLDEVIEDSDIDICHKVDVPNSRAKNIVVRFTRRTKRNAVLAKARKTRLTTEDLGFDGTSKPVYINEHLTRKNKQLLGAASSRKKAVGWKYVWSSNGKVLARRAESTTVLHIRSVADIDRMTPSSPIARSSDNSELLENDALPSQS